MNNVEAVQKAKTYILEVFEDEEILELGLEELRFEHSVWEVTIGFRRRWQRSGAPPRPSLGLPSFSPPANPTRERTYKTVRIRDDGTVIEMKHRDVSVPA
ncbi:MAG: hypothetical protein OXH99_09615 [Bryobacterales bacterium]|nr:hypothetical protein [Bryobacterales bacterium]